MLTPISYFVFFPTDLNFVLIVHLSLRNWNLNHFCNNLFKNKGKSHLVVTKNCISKSRGSCVKDCWVFKQCIDQITISRTYTLLMNIEKPSRLVL
jgi:hypothetical protein